MKPFDTFKFRCHNFGTLATKAKTGNGLSQTAKSELLKIYAENLGFKKEIVSKYLEKGNACEDGAISVLGDFLGEFLVKNDAPAEDSVNVGIADVVSISGNYVIDIKCSYNYKSFLEAELSTIYAWQLFLYKQLYGVGNAYLAYVLMPTPEEILRKYNASEDEISENLMYKNMPFNERIKIFDLGEANGGIGETEALLSKRLEIATLSRNYLAEIQANRAFEVSALENLKLKKWH